MEVKRKENLYYIWNNKDITIDQKMLFWKSWFEQGIYFVQDLLNKNGNFLSLQEFNEKFRMNQLTVPALLSNYFYYTKFNEANCTANPNFL